MKQFFILAVAILWVNIVFAQHSNLRSGRTALHHQVLMGLLQQNTGTPMTAMRTTSVTLAERVISQRTRDSINELRDSVSVNYTAYRTSTYDYNTMIYPYYYPYNASPMFNTDKGVFTKPQVLYDTFLHWEIDPNTLTYGFYEAGYATYSATNNLTGYLYLNADSTILIADGFRNPNVLYANKFNAANNIDTGYWFNWQAGTADSAFKQFFTYNSSNKLTKDSTYEYHLGVWRIVSKTFYTYDASNDLTQIDNYANDTDSSLTLPLVELLKYVNTYDASHRLLTTYSSFFDQDSLLPYIEDTFAYSGTYTYHSAWREYQYDPINAYWAPMSNMTKKIGSSGLPDTVDIDTYDSLSRAWIPETMDVISYNSFHDPDTLRDYEYDFTAYPSSPSYTTVYYYSTYTANSAAVNNVPVIGDNVKVFPNPATGTVTITQLDVPVNAAITISVINVSGQWVSRERLDWQNQATISIAGLEPGVYWIYIQDGSGNTVCRKPVVKQ